MIDCTSGIAPEKHHARKMPQRTGEDEEKAEMRTQVRLQNGEKQAT